MAKTDNEKAYDKGGDDYRQDRYDPPGGTGWTDHIQGQIAGYPETRESYQEGREAAKQDGK